MTSDETEFREFVAYVEPRLHRALAAQYGWDGGREATAEALAYAWEHRKRVLEMDNPAGYLFRVAKTAMRRSSSRRLLPPDFTSASHEPWVEPNLAQVLAGLPERQRVTVVLVHGYGWTAAEVAEVIGVSRNTVLSHLERGLRQLRSKMEVHPGARLG